MRCRASWTPGSAQSVTRAVASGRPGSNTSAGAVASTRAASGGVPVVVDRDAQRRSACTSRANFDQPGPRVSFGPAVPLVAAAVVCCAVLIVHVVEDRSAKSGCVAAGDRWPAGPGPVATCSCLEEFGELVAAWSWTAPRSTGVEADADWQGVDEGIDDAVSRRSPALSRPKRTDAEDHVADGRTRPTRTRPEVHVHDTWPRSCPGVEPTVRMAVDPVAQPAVCSRTETAACSTMGGRVTGPRLRRAATARRSGRPRRRGGR